MPTIEVYACVRDIDREVLTINLHRSPDIVSGEVPCEILWNTKSAATAYNGALASANADIVVFTHSDVYFPQGWFARLATQLEELTQRDPSWAIAGLVGRDSKGEFAGRTWDQGIGGLIGVPLTAAHEVVTLDEFVLILRRDAGLEFDPGVPDFHYYGADLIMEAERRGRRTYALDMPVIHNSKPITRLPDSFMDAYRYVAAKWRASLPRYGIVVDLTRGPWQLWFRALRIRYRGTLRRSTMNFTRLRNPALVAIHLGLESPPPKKVTQ